MKLHESDDIVKESEERVDFLTPGKASLKMTNRKCLKVTN